MTANSFTMYDEKHRSIDDVMHEIQLRRIRRKQQERNVEWYPWLISEHPFLVLFLCLCLITVSAVISVLFVEPPDFDKPSKGFEVRGTLLANRIVTWNNILSQTGFNTTLSYYPYVYAKERAIYASIQNTKKYFTEVNETNISGISNSTRKRRSTQAIPYKWDFVEDGYFCDNPKSSVARIVIESNEWGKSMWSVKKQLEICNLEKSLLSHEKYPDICSRQTLNSCCPSLSLPNYIAYLAGLRKCEDIDDEALYKVEVLLSECADYYSTGNLTSLCWDVQSFEDKKATDVCNHVPYKCVQFNAVYSIFHYMVDDRFIKSLPKIKDNQTHYKEQINLQYTSVFLASPRGRHLKPVYYDNFQSSKNTNQSSVIVASLDFGLKDTVFEDMLVTDKIYPIIALAMVAVIVALYTGSVFIMIMSIISSVSALIIAYFLYAVIFEFAFFPFMNLMTIMVIIGIGADNVFVYCSTWKTNIDEDCRESCVERKRPAKHRLGVITKLSLKHAARSMFVTGITTAAAFLSNYASSVTAIKCFGVYAGLTVLTIFFLSVTWIPASFVIYETRLRQVSCHLPKKFCVNIKTLLSTLKHCFKDICSIFFTKLQLLLIFQYRVLWLTVCPLLAISGCLLIFYSPKLKLPTSNDNFQYFKPNHLFETYHMKYKEKFEFEKDNVGFMPITIVFGINPVDNGDATDPGNTGKFEFNEEFNVLSKSSQKWLLEFCTLVQNQSFVQQSVKNTYHSYKTCFVAPFKKWMESTECFQDGKDLRPCCQKSKFPYEPKVFEQCLKKAVLKLSQTPGVHLHENTPGPRFDANDTLRAVILEFPSVLKYTGGYEEIDLFFKRVDNWMNERLKMAPPGLQGGWFVSELDFFSLQEGLYRGTILALLLSVGVVCAAMILTTCNLAITFLASVSIAFTIFVTIGILVLLQWELNILESVTISIAIGLSVDFTVHYGVAYLVAPGKDRLSRVEYSCIKMGPALTLAALTTFIAGLCMVPAQVIAYYKFGVFLMIIMSCSWFYSTYFFQSLCGIFGPENNCGNFFCYFKCFKRSKQKVKDQKNNRKNVVYLKEDFHSHCDTVIELPSSKRENKE